MFGLPWLIMMPGKWHGHWWMSHVGCFYAHSVYDTPPWRITRYPVEYWGAQYFCYAVVFDCRGGRIGMEILGEDSIRGTKNNVLARYDAAILDIKETAPALHTFIDVRTLEMVLAGCCPHMLMEVDTK